MNNDKVHRKKYLITNGTLKKESLLRGYVNNIILIPMHLMI